MAASKFTPARRAKIIRTLEQGASRACAAATAGLAVCTVYAWVDRGKSNSSGIYKEFSEAVIKAETAAELRHISNINAAADKGSWQASAWWLERVKRERYGRWGPKPERQKPQRLTDKELEALKASDKALTVDDATAVWKRQLMLLEKAYLAGEVDSKTYFTGLHSLTQAATKMAELHLRGAGDTLPTVTVVLEANSPHIAKPRPEPVEIIKTEHCGDLIEVS